VKPTGKSSLNAVSGAMGEKRTGGGKTRGSRTGVSKGQGKLPLWGPMGDSWNKGTAFRAPWARSKKGLKKDSRKFHLNEDPGNH